MDGLCSERLRLRPMTDGDADHLLTIFSDPVAMRYYRSTKDRQETERWIGWTLENYRQHGIGLWIVERALDGAFLGQCGLVPQEIDGRMEIEIGYLFVRAHWGNGYATEAARICRDFGFQKLSALRLISLIDPENLPSQRVASRIGMTRVQRTCKWGKELDVFAMNRPD